MQFFRFQGVRLLLVSGSAGQTVKHSLTNPGHHTLLFSNTVETQLWWWLFSMWQTKSPGCIGDAMNVCFLTWFHFPHCALMSISGISDIPALIVWSCLFGQGTLAWHQRAAVKCAYSLLFFWTRSNFHCFWQPISLYCASVF